MNQCCYYYFCLMFTNTMSVIIIYFSAACIALLSAAPSWLKDGRSLGLVNQQESCTWRVGRKNKLINCLIWMSHASGHTKISLRPSGVPSATDHSRVLASERSTTCSLLRSSCGSFVAWLNSSHTTTAKANMSLLVVYSSSCMHSGASQRTGSSVLRCLWYSRLYLSLQRAG